MKTAQPFQPRPGATLLDACAEAAVLANLNRDEIRFTHGGIAMVARPGDTGWKVDQQFHAATARAGARLVCPD